MKDIQIETHLIIERVLDGDSLIVRQEYGQIRKEIRLYGLDAPEVKISRKTKEDEVKSHVPASLLVQYGLMSLDFMVTLAPVGTRITILTEPKNRVDFWKRQLAYVILPNGKCLNEELIKNGYAKASHHYYCEKLTIYQAMNFEAKQQKRGIYLFIDVL
ncbi:thermonuclease family protein [Chryseobacterium oryzae]|uniref:Thermonuclease family protein n=1 Tax=Chryseobacterium oryzae TaxID=2929799 RepID=A0ABY4BJ04_9FLAO|nr:thermonuclease family protein [Chryseobacterium oryzae]UOE39169.1 thermonuclease family protein [Chryseobacterium oryzae]